MKIYYFNITPLRNRSIFESQIKKLDDDRQVKTQRLKVTADKLRCVGAGMLINFVKQQYGVKGDVRIDKFGKPYFEDSNVHFNVSHSGMYVIIAVSEYNIGIDIQKIKSDKHRIAEKNFMPSECDYINNATNEKDVQQRFCEVWTTKEAYLKCVGIGLRKPLNSFEISLNQDTICVVGEENYKFVQFMMDDKYIVTVCGKQADQEFDIQEVLI